ncbi:hypothetical protein Tco_0597745, partial [Tanacetum coccineum]
VMAVPGVSVSPEECFRETIEIGVDVTYLVPITSVVFLASTIVMRLAQHGEVVRGIHEGLLEMPTHEELRALRNRADIVEVERATLRARIRMMGAVETSLCNRMRDERQTRIEIERHLALV